MSNFVIGRQYLGYALGDANNSVLITLGDNLTGDTEASHAQLYQQVGFCSLPPNPVPGNSSTEFITLIDGTNREVCIGSRHTSSQGLYANMRPGDSMMYACGPNGAAQGRVKTNGSDGSVTLMTTDDNTSSGNVVSLRLAPTGLSFTSPWLTFFADQTGFHIQTLDGARFDLIPTQDVTTGGNACMITAGQVSLVSSSINLGPQTGVCFPAIISINPQANPGVPITGEGTGAIVVNAIASPCVNICGIAV